MTKSKIFLISLAMLMAAVMIAPGQTIVKADRGESKDNSIELQTNDANQKSDHETDVDEQNEFGENESENLPADQSLLTIRPQGNVRIQNASVSVNNGRSLQVKIFGLNLTVNLASSTELIDVILNASSSSFADIKTGDSIDVSGTIDSGSGAITALKVRDNSLKQQRIDTIRQQIDSLLQQLRQLQEQLQQLHKNQEGNS